MAKILKFMAPATPAVRDQIPQELLRDIEDSLQMRSLIDAKLLRLTGRALELIDRGAICEPGELCYHKHLGVQKTEAKKEA